MRPFGDAQGKLCPYKGCKTVDRDGCCRAGAPPAGLFFFARFRISSRGRKRAGAADSRCAPSRCGASGDAEAR
jgi:hypothetical protein